MRSYSEFNTTPDHAYNIRRALTACKAAGEDGLYFPKDTYELKELYAFEKFYTMSNHGFNNLKRIGFLLEEMENFTIDGGGSKFIFHEGMMGFTVENCTNITLKNFTVDADDILLMETKVTKKLENGFEADVLNDQKYMYEGNKIRFQDHIYDLPVCLIMVRGREGSMDFLPYSRDYYEPYLIYTPIGERSIRVEGKDFTLEEGDIVTIGAHCRHSSNIYLKDSINTRVENVVLNRSRSMGIIAEKCTDIFIDSLKVTPPEGAMVSLKADATHFVHCKGMITIQNSLFEGQMDDALNIHGVFTRIVAKDPESITVYYVHPESIGLGIYDKGSRFRTVERKTCIPVHEYTIKDVEVLNSRLTRIFVEGGTDDIEVGMNIEDITWTAGLIFRNNTVRYNRARGMLIAAYGDVLIENNYYHTAGCPILFQSDGEGWCESGGTNHVVIRNNTFEGCKFAHDTWGGAVIELCPRSEYDGVHNYHGYLEIEKNRFIDSCEVQLRVDNVAELVVHDNRVEGNNPGFGYARNCGKVTSDMPLI